MPAADPLLEPFRLRWLTLRNRLMSTAHEPAYSEDGLPKDRYRAYHVEKAKGGVALTVACGSAVVSRDSPEAFGNLHAWKDELTPWLAKMADEVHAEGAAIMMQITHLGRRTNWNKGDWLPALAPSPIREPAHRAFPKEAEDWDIDRIVADYADAAERIVAAGVDGIELEAYGHLADQFWSPETNRRDDAYGGSLDNRLRFTHRILDAIRARIGARPLLGVRMVADEAWRGPDGEVLGLQRADGVEIARRLAATGQIDFLNLIRGHIESDAALRDVIPTHGMPSAPHLDFCGEIRAAAAFPVFHAARIADVATARHAVASGKLDMVGMTRAHLADPHIARKVMAGAEARIRPCVGATYCLDRIYEGGEALCIHNAATGREQTMPHEIAPSAGPRRRAVVVGAGPAGLEAARVLGARGHAVTLLEATARPGGQVALAAAAPRRRELIGLIDWRMAECAAAGVEIRFDTLAEPEDIRALAPDLVILATGGSPNTETIAGRRLPGAELVVSSWDVLAGAAPIAAGSEALVFDDHAGHPGLAAAEALGRAGARVEIVTPERFFAADVGGLNHAGYAKAFDETGVRVTIQRRLLAVAREGNRLVATLGSDHSAARELRVVDRVVVEHGTLPNDGLYHALKPESRNLGQVDYAALIAGRPQALAPNPGGAFQLFRIGDAVSGRNIHAAIYDGLRLCKDF